MGSLDVLFGKEGGYAKVYKDFQNECNFSAFETILRSADLYINNIRAFLHNLDVRNIDPAFLSMSYNVKKEMTRLREALKLPKLQIIKSKKRLQISGIIEHEDDNKIKFPLTDENIETLLELAKSLEQNATDGDELSAYRFGLFNAIGLFPDSTFSQALKYLQLADAANIPGSKRALAHLALRLSFFEK